MITCTCLRWPKGHRSIKTHPEQVYQRKAAGEGSGGSGEAATLERVYGPHPNTGDFFSDTFTALIPPSVAKEEPERGLLLAVFNRDGMAKKRLTPMYLSSTFFDLNLMQSALRKVCLGFWPSTKLPEEEDTPEAQQALKELHNEMTTFLFSDVSNWNRFTAKQRKEFLCAAPFALANLGKRENPDLSVPPVPVSRMEVFARNASVVCSLCRTVWTETALNSFGPADEREQKVKSVAEEIEAKCSVRVF
uniref:Uncharacterized protein n=1 Tax=Chromera velia CCMP2878 TaxID=1169474 RepID=A0A0G4GH37_9ALVE|eukprot:Cvel_21812.t1-p1 / transcript=Cvel_21812.t1 / gene=Cvel_21812 / organism=Chromera_velia_CCMP2878 / gene_product=hypothetical protein / transcript_product=hypothetical protein / location=Cvel_scaffold2080:7411-8625(-) / protein_length=247 / sequence_SO=supercontig / SO=protein_coding / is_pseudo=false